ncbi:hypothetical protein B2J88_06620, partial [Rhodococcus sp. SRB_17]|nr:hypothetical protein [Rhodococcus sp. SRB_17]
GVQVEHRNVVDLMATLPAATDLGVDDTVLSVASYTFDMSVGDYFVTLGLGASLVVATTEQMHDPRRLAELIESSRATRMSATPTSWAALLAAGWAGRPGLLAASVGEPLPDALAASLTEVCAGVWNGWGPTETTVFAGGGLVRSDEPVTVGRPLPGTRVYVTDTKGRLLPLGVPGEIVIGGPGVSRGYLSRPEETAKRFGRDPFMEGERVYRSGDRGRLLSDGRLQHLGRFDNQVKIRGFRIELGEIECVLREHPGVAAAALDVQQDQSGRPRLAAFIVEDAMHYNECESEAECDAELRAWTRRRLPDYMVPAVIIRVTSLPTSPSGKLDRRALAELTVAQSNSLTTVESSAVETAGTVTISATPGMSETEVVIASLWSMLLGAEVVDVDRNFFDLGGHSLLAANLVAQIEHRMGVTVSLVDFLDHGTTVAGLARLVARASSSKGQSARDGEAAGDGRPVFFVYPDLASAMSLRHLRRLWGSEQSAYPLLPLAAPSQPDRSYTVEQLAEPLLSTVREIQPIGPYALVGFSFGGLVAYELARQLDQADQRVEWLGVLDTPTPEMARQLMRRWKSSSARIARLREPGRVKLVADYLGNLRWSIREKLIDVGFAERHPSEEFDLRGAWEIMQRYRGCGHAAPLELFVTSTTAAEVRTPLLGWDAFHGGSLRTRFLEGSHDSILDSPQIEELAALILTGIHGAREDASR